MTPRGGSEGFYNVDVLHSGIYFKQIAAFLTFNDPAQEPRYSWHFCHVVCLKVFITGRVRMAAVAEDAPQLSGHSLVIHSNGFSACIKHVAP